MDTITDSGLVETTEDGRKSITMCCGGKKCPVLSADGQWITITDDFGGSVKIPRTQEHAFIEAVGRLFY